MTPATRRGFPSPFEVPIPAGCEGWEEMYPYHAVFSEDRRAFDEEPLLVPRRRALAGAFLPVRFLMLDYAVVAFNQASSRLFVVPPSLGVECGVLNGYVYLSANSVTDEATLARREELFARRGGYYYEHWDELYERWWRRSSKRSGSSRRSWSPTCPSSRTRRSSPRPAAAAPATPSSSPTTACSRDSTSSGSTTSSSSNLGYGAYLVFYELCRQAFPDITDQTIAKMVSGIDVVAPASGRRAQAPRPARARARCCRGYERRARRGGAPGGLSRDRLTAPVARRLRRDEEPVVLLLLRKRPLPPPSLVDRRHAPFRSR